MYLKNLTEIYQIRLTKEQKNYIDKQASINNISTADYLRLLINSYMFKDEELIENI